MRVVFIVFFVVIFGVTTSVFAKENVFDHPIPENTFPLELKKLSGNFERFQSIRTRFIQTKQISVLKQPLVTKGLFVSAPEYGVYWKIESPFNTEILITSGGYYQRKDGDWISEAPASAKSQIQAYLKAFLLVFSGKFEELREYFTLSFLKRENAWNETIEIIDNNNGEHLETIEILKVVAKVKNNFKRIGDTEQECFDPVHINDVRIIKKQNYADYFTNGKIGDLLVSLREIDAVVLMDKDTYDIKWITRGNFTRQHSPRITNKGTILIFDNQSSLPPNGVSRIVEIDIKTNKLVGFYEATNDNFFESENRGRLQIVDNRIFVQEHNQGRLFELICNSQYISNSCKQKNIIELKENNRGKGYYLADIVRIQ